jgi:2-amino-4-hydroxy-6-hydroxymethyldihydropteridine diphosphokinase
MSHVGKPPTSRALLLGLGANVAGPWGVPRQSLTRALREIERIGVNVVRVSTYYATNPVGGTPQPQFLNAVVLAQAYIAPGSLLRSLKRIEREGGRTMTRHLGRRPLDIDILDYGGRRIGRPGGGRERGRLQLPHPEMQARAFVLVPLQEVAPFWRHPATGIPVKTLLARLAAASVAEVVPSP